MSIIYGYMRVSSIDQNEDRQLIELRKFGVADENIYMDKMSGKDFNRPGYQKLRRKCRPGDLLVVKSLDRLGRNYNDIIAEWGFLTKKKQVDILILDMPLLDTRRDRDLIGTLISDIVLQLLSYVAQVERENIRQRQAEGIATAISRGVRFGRPPLQIPPQFPDYYRLWKMKKFKPADAMQHLGLTASQFYWMKRNYENNLMHSSMEPESPEAEP